MTIHHTLASFCILHTGNVQRFHKFHNAYFQLTSASFIPPFTQIPHVHTHTDIYIYILYTQSIIPDNLSSSQQSSHFMALCSAIIHCQQPCPAMIHCDHPIRKANNTMSTLQKYAIAHFSLQLSHTRLQRRATPCHTLTNYTRPLHHCMDPLAAISGNT